MRFLAAAMRPIATLDAWHTNRRIAAAQRQHALDTARIEAVSHGRYFRTPEEY